MITTPCQTISDTLGDLFSCTTMDNGFTRIRTPYLYPDGEVIDLYYKVTSNNSFITDLGETIRWLYSQMVNDFLSPKQQQGIQDILLTHDVEQYRGTFMIRLRSDDSLADAITRLSQVALSVSNLWFLSKTRVISSLQDEIAELLRESRIKFEANEKLLGRSGRSWRVNFHTWHSDHSSLVQILSTGSKAAANTKANNVLAGWHDLSSLKVGSQALRFISLFDDTLDIWNMEIISQLEEFSDIAYWSDPEGFLEMLTRSDNMV
ncbi:DUF1828 domain-containing protein [Geminocystis sp. CENA526]|uniref:DUF1828 domain-containing protein n=1 Tax=Geminocystis sp. CENA526 TaxID=1355871 RepID=UPI003D6E952B